MAQSETAATSQRFEFKYLLSDSLAMAVSDYLQFYMNPDAYGDGAGRYSLNSLYYDSPDLRLYSSSAFGERNRHKLRCRWYGNAMPSMVYAEIKRRNDQVIRKNRAKLSVGRAAAALCRNDTLADTPDDAESWGEGLHAYRNLLDRYHASPKVLVRYDREAYSCAVGTPIRVTLDRALQGSPCFSLTSALEDEGLCWFEVNAIPTILEVKFSDTYPKWLSEMTRRFELRARSVCKYLLCVEEIMRHGIQLRGDRAGLVEVV